MPQYVTASIVLEEWAKTSIFKRNVTTQTWRGPREVLERDSSQLEVPLGKGVFPAMVKDALLTEELRATLDENPDVPEEYQSKPSLLDLLKLPEWAELASMVNRRLKNIPQLKSRADLLKFHEELEA